MKSSYSSRFSRFFCGFLALTALTTATTARAEEKANPYDQLSTTLIPIAKVFTPGGEHRALSATLVLEAMTGLPPEQSGGRLEVVIEPPGRALLRGTLGLREVTALRVGQALWLSPAAVHSSVPVESKPPKKKKKKKKKQEQGLDPLALPFPPAQLALLPMLFVIKEGPLDPEGLRVLELRLMPELARSISQSHPDARAGEWHARISLKKGRLERIQLARPDWAVVVRVERLELSGPLPASTWEAPATDTVRLDGPEARRWLNALGQVLNRQADRLRTPPQ